MTRGQWRRQAVTRLLNRTWFSRVWVFQESVVSADVKVVCGSTEFPLSDLFRITSAVFALEDADGGYFRSIAKRTVGFDTLFLIQHNRKGGCESDDCPRLVMQALQQLHATKELDLIYAFVGFNPSSKIEIDYDLPVSTAWINASRVMIQNSGSLDIFAAVRGDEKCKYDLPSWVPDFSNCYPYARPISAPDFITNFQASGGLPHTWKDADHPETLIVKGKLVGKIEWLSPPSFDHKSSREEGTGTEAVLDFENHAAAMERYLSLNDAVSPQKEHELLGGYSKIIRTMLADGAFGHEQPLQHSIEDIIRVCKKEQSIQDGTEDYNILEKLRQWGLIVQQKRLFLSDNYDMGLVPKTAHRGDLICLLHGSKVPCVLRRNEASEGNYRIISQCYLDGMMYCDGSPETMAGLKEEAREFALA
ncbi:unnamed protein product [Clonostachys rosea f. rosea IK726]|uniref:Uncharacterized protein n=1 Tax=Clonostachys rosea f. rosea IK726 TaxID=1349383 RepID=A0ACA9UML5_BIOOC|nr:unnamed protein product [Clonostachys rosea f. rosea IK726]